MKAIVLLAGAALLAVVVPAAAQTGPESPVLSSPCQAQPEPNDSGEDANTANREAETEDLTGKLAPCDGVLDPPPTGDDEMTEPAPDEGKTPIVRPGEVPEQPSQQ